MNFNHVFFVLSHSECSELGLFWFGLVWFGLFVHPFFHICNTRHDNYRLQFLYYNTMYNIWASTQYNTINNNTKFKDQLEVEFLTTSRYMCIYINLLKSEEFKLKLIM